MLWLHTAAQRAKAGLSQEQLLPALGHSTLQSSPGQQVPGHAHTAGTQRNSPGDGQNSSRAALGAFVLYEGVVLILLPLPVSSGGEESQRGAPTAPSTHPFLAALLVPKLTHRSELSKHFWELLPLGKQILCSRALSCTQGCPRAQEEPQG